MRKMQKKIRPDPLIPDHEVLRKIGGGAYGEVWLARGVTGAMRAVKVVYREDFTDERTFEREFEGILRFEPISRDHRGFVNILHVGRSEGESAFYYYVMELGDDVFSEGEINPVEYEPRTLRTDMKRANGAPLGTDFCLETGLRLAEALAELHQHGLTHRDVKPSNVIFVEGKAKLADIGLVAAKDQRTFVGTEGFVPPEGPGSQEADLYSLGKVLYEMATGMDRLQFPELPEGGAGDDEQKKWIKLNRLICEMCDPRLAKRKITSGSDLADALGRLLKGQSRAYRLPRAFKWVAAVGVIFAIVASQIWIEKTWGTYVIEGKREPLPARFVSVKILSNPPGAVVRDQEGNFIDITPTTISNVAVFSRLNLVLSATGYRDCPIDQSIKDDNDGTQVVVIERDLTLFSPPRMGEVWVDALGRSYLPDGESHESAQYISAQDWATFREQSGNKNLKAPKVRHNGDEIVFVREEWANLYAEWLMGKCLREGYFEMNSETDRERNREIIARIDRGFPEEKIPAPAKTENSLLFPFRCIVRFIPYGLVKIESTPTGALVYLSDGRVEETPVEIEARPGWLEWTVELEGHTTEIGSGYLTDGGIIEKHYLMEDNQSLRMGLPWTNSLQMNLVPLGDGLMVGAWEVRTGDFRQFLRTTKTPQGQVILAKDPNQPVVGVTKKEAQDFCVWLTEMEQKQGSIKKDFKYRLPSDEEWSRMVELVEQGSRPETRELLFENQGRYPWGLDWPPPQQVGNFADASAAKEDLPSEFTITQYDDGFAGLAPVGSFPANELGIFDLGGNAREWVSDDYKGRGLLRGASWKSFNQTQLESRFRYPAIEARNETWGFRVVLSREVVSNKVELSEREVSDGDSQTDEGEDDGEN